MNYFDADLSYKKPIYASRKNSNLISPLNLLQQQYKNLADNKASKRKKKPKSKKCKNLNFDFTIDSSKSSLWIKNKLLKRQNKKSLFPLKSLLKGNFMVNLGKISRSQNRTAAIFSKHIKIKKVS